MSKAIETAHTEAIRVNRHEGFSTDQLKAELETHLGRRSRGFIVTTPGGQSQDQVIADLEAEIARREAPDRRIIVENPRGEYIADYIFTGTTREFSEAYNLTPKHRPYRTVGTVETGGGYLLHWGVL